MIAAEQWTDQRAGNTLAWLALLAASGYQIYTAAFTSTQFILQYTLVLDDAFYYFQIARNIARLGWATFDGIHASSGIQLLWEGILCLLARFFTGRIEFLRAVLVTCAVLNTISGVLLYRLARSLYSPKAGIAAILIWSGFMVRLTPTMMGMEYSLHAVVILCTMTLFWRVWSNAESFSLKNTIILGLFLTLNFWTRLDSALYSLLILFSAVLIFHLKDDAVFRERIVFLVSPLVIGAVAYVIICKSLAGTSVPISGLVKHQYATHFFDGYGWRTALHNYLEWYGRIQGRTVLNLVIPLTFAGTAYGIRHWTILSATLIAVLYACISIYQKRRSDPMVFRALTFVLLLLLSAIIHVALIVGTIGQFGVISNHYYAWLFLTWCLAAAIFVAYILSLIGSKTIRQTAILLLLLGLLLPNLWLILRQRSKIITPNLNNRRVETASWINQHLPQTSRIGAWNAGILAYFTDRTTVNLDGLTNDRNYLMFLKSKQPVEVYLRKESVEYVCDVDMNDLTTPYGQHWGHSKLFRNNIPWKHAEIVYQDKAQQPLVILRLKQPR